MHRTGPTMVFVQQLLLLQLLLLFSHPRAAAGHSLNGTLCLNACSGHGLCSLAADGPTCSCYNGWGADSDTTSYRAPDCSSMTCPSSTAWAWVATSNVSSHPVMECSNQGICDHTTGLCRCMPGFMGPACERRACPNDCSGHGQCLSMKVLASRSDGMPLSNPTSYQVVQANNAYALGSKVWDDEKIYGCLCDSSWPVGLGSGQRQASEWFGPDCSQRHCPSADDPITAVDETNCYNVTAAGGSGVGQAGNLCHVDCANRGVCDYSSGTCTCFSTFFGLGCSLREGY